MDKYFVFHEMLTKIKPLYWEGQAVFTQYTKLKNYLSKHLGENYTTIFSIPEVAINYQSEEKGRWIVEALPASNITALNRLSGEEQEKYRIAIEKLISVITDFSKTLLQSQQIEEQRWGTLIAKCLVIPGKEYILVSGDQFVLTCWGFEPVSELNKPFDVSGFFYKPGQTNAASLQAPNVSSDEELQGETAQAIWTDRLLQSQQSNPIPENENIFTNNQSNNPTTEIKEKETVISDLTITETFKPNGSRSEIKEGRKSSKGWWLLLLLLLIPFFFLLKNCTTIKPLLPERHRHLIPIDPSKIIDDTTTRTRIVSDRLNIKLIGSNKDLYSFAKKFKEVYPSSFYQIIYYDTVTSRVQIQIPASERIKTKDEIKGKLPDFKLIVTNETIFQNSNTPDDPAFQVPEETWYQERVKAPSAWDYTQGDSSLIIAILDDGFDLLHPELKGKVINPWNIITGNTDITTYGKLVHGTHVAGIALGWADNKSGGAGIASNCRFMPVQIADYNGIMSTNAVIDAFVYAVEHGASVINMSLGMQFSPLIEQFPPGYQLNLINTILKDDEALWEEVFDLAYQKNIVVVLAGGNQNIMVGLDPMERSNKTIKVSATNFYDQKAQFSNYGPYSTISAPGVHIYSSVPGNYYRFMDGTSMAAPIVTGSVALIKSINPALANNQIVDLLQSTGLPVNSPGKPIGNLVQLDRALQIARKDREEMPVADCPEVQKQIDSLLQIVANLRDKCSRGNETHDTLKILPGTENLSFASGRWKSTSYLYSVSDGKKVTLYFTFNADGTGTIELVDSDNTECSATLSLSLQGSDLKITQLESARCVPPPKEYNAYKFTCRPDANNCAVCNAVNQSKSSNKFEFNLVKIR